MIQMRRLTLLTLFVFFHLSMSIKVVPNKVLPIGSKLHSEKTGLIKGAPNKPKQLSEKMGLHASQKNKLATVSQKSKKSEGYEKFEIDFFYSKTQDPYINDAIDLLALKIIPSINDFISDHILVDSGKFEILKDKKIETYEELKDMKFVKVKQKEDLDVDFNNFKSQLVVFIKVDELGDQEISRYKILEHAENGRTTFAVITIRASTIKTFKKGYTELAFDLFWAIFRDIGHILVLDKTLFEKLQLTFTPFEGLKRTLWTQNQNLKHYEIDIPELTAFLKTHFNCDTIKGAIFEHDEDNKGKNILGFDRMIFYSDLMTGSNDFPKTVTKLLVYLLNFSKWYQANIEIGEDLLYGKGRGCDWYYGKFEEIKQSFSTDLPKWNDVYFSSYFCDQKNQHRCSFNGDYKATCQSDSQGQLVLKSFQDGDRCEEATKCTTIELTTMEDEIKYLNECFQYRCHEEDSSVSFFLEKNKPNPKIVCQKTDAGKKMKITNSISDKSLICPDVYSYCSPPLLGKKDTGQFNGRCFRSSYYCNDGKDGVCLKMNIQDPVDKTKTILGFGCYYINEVKISNSGNWYEERLAPKQTTNVESNAKSREVEKEISFPSKGTLHPLARLARREPWKTQGVLPDDGFVFNLKKKEFRSIFQTNYDDKNLKILQNTKDNASCLKKVEKQISFPENNPHSALVQQSKHKGMINVMNMESVLKEERKVKLEKTDFGSTLRFHPPDYNRMYHLTTYMDSYTKATKGSSSEPFAFKALKHSGLPSTKLNTEVKGKRIQSLLVAETLKNEADPKQNTRCQKKWLPTNDPGIESVLNKQRVSSTGFSSSQANFDIATSLPLGEGEHALKRKYLNPGEFRKIRSDVTMIKNKIITKK